MLFLIYYASFKNAFLPTEANKEGKEDAIMIDFSCTGIGYGMSDVGMHIVHAVLPNDFENGGEEWLVEGYLSALEVRTAKLEVKMCGLSERDGEAAPST